MLWLWCRLAAVVPIRPLAWDLPYVAGAALRRRKKKREREKDVQIGGRYRGGEINDI